MSLRIHTGDICVINSERDSIKEYNGVVCQVASYYPAEIDESKISNLHDVIVLGPAFGRTNHTINTLRVHPDELFKIDLVKSCLKFIRTDLNPPDIPEVNSPTDSDEKALSVIEKYLDQETMTMVARQVFQAKMNRIFDQTYEARCKIGQSLYDEIIVKITDEQLKKFEPELNGIFMKRIEQEILRTDKPEEGDQTFREWLRFALQCKAGEWIKEHQAEVYDLMQDSIQVAASHLCQDKLCEALGDQVGKILKDKF